MGMGRGRLGRGSTCPLGTTGRWDIGCPRSGLHCRRSRGGRFCWGPLRGVEGWVLGWVWGVRVSGGGVPGVRSICGGELIARAAGDGVCGRCVCLNLSGNYDYW